MRTVYLSEGTHFGHSYCDVLFSVVVNIPHYAISRDNNKYGTNFSGSDSSPERLNSSFAKLNMPHPDHQFEWFISGPSFILNNIRAYRCLK